MVIIIEKLKKVITIIQKIYFINEDEIHQSRNISYSPLSEYLRILVHSAADVSPVHFLQL